LRAAAPAEPRIPASDEELAMLKSALETGDVGMADRLVELLSGRGDEHLREVMDKVSYHVLVSDYQAAARLVVALMSPRGGVERGMA
jgi:hypothetical protein